MAPMCQPTWSPGFDEFQSLPWGAANDFILVIKKLLISILLERPAEYNIQSIICFVLSFP